MKTTWSKAQIPTTTTTTTTTIAKVAVEPTGTAGEKEHNRYFFFVDAEGGYESSK